MFACARTVEDIERRRTRGGGECRSQAGCKRPLWGRTDQTPGVGPPAWSGTETRQVNINRLNNTWPTEIQLKLSKQSVLSGPAHWVKAE